MPNLDVVVSTDPEPVSRSSGYSREKQPERSVTAGSRKISLTTGFGQAPEVITADARNPVPTDSLGRG
jgi:hypothetical protein